MIWIKRRYNNTTWATTPLFDTVEKHFMVLAAPPEMLMIEQEHNVLDSTVWIRLPDRRHAAIYPGFEEASPEALPRKATLLIGHNAEFEKTFEYGQEAR